MDSGMRRTITSTEQFERRPLTARNSEIDTKTRLLDAAERLFSDTRVVQRVPGAICALCVINGDGTTLTSLLQNAVIT
jgi:hypothetical protein